MTFRPSRLAGVCGVLLAGAAMAQSPADYRINILKYGPPGGAAIETALLKADGNQYTHFYFPQGEYTLTTNVTFPVNSTIELAPAAHLNVPTNLVLTFQANDLLAHSEPHFYGPGTVTGTVNGLWGCWTDWVDATAENYLVCVGIDPTLDYLSTLTTAPVPSAEDICYAQWTIEPDSTWAIDYEKQTRNSTGLVWSVSRDACSVSTTGTNAAYVVPVDGVYEFNAWLGLSMPTHNHTNDSIGVGLQFGFDANGNGYHDVDDSGGAYFGDFREATTNFIINNAYQNNVNGYFSAFLSAGERVQVYLMVQPNVNSFVATKTTNITGNARFDAHFWGRRVSTF